MYCRREPFLCPFHFFPLFVDISIIFFSLREQILLHMERKKRMFRHHLHPEFNIQHIHKNSQPGTFTLPTQGDAKNKSYFHINMLVGISGELYWMNIIHLSANLLLNIGRWHKAGIIRSCINLLQKRQKHLQAYHHFPHLPHSSLCHKDYYCYQYQ